MSKENLYLVDTDILIYWLNNKYPRIDRMLRDAGTKNIYISSISIAELFYGAYHSSFPDKNIALVRDLASSMNIIDFDSEAAEIFGELKNDLKKGGQIINDSDLFIAATAIANKLILVSNNEKHFRRIKQLSLENWIK